MRIIFFGLILLSSFAIAEISTDQVSIQDLINQGKLSSAEKLLQSMPRDDPVYVKFSSEIVEKKTTAIQYYEKSKAAWDMAKSQLEARRRPENELLETALHNSLSAIKIWSENITINKLYIELDALRGTDPLCLNVEDLTPCKY